MKDGLTVAEYRERKCQMDNELKEAIVQILNRFEVDTGLTPSAVEVWMQPTRPVSKKSTRFVLLEVATTVPLED